MKKSAFTLKVETELKALAPKKFSGKFKPEDFLRGNGKETSLLKFLNISMPVLRNYLEDLNGAGFTEMQNLWFESDIFDAKVIPVCWLDLQSTEFLIKNSKSILKWATEIDNWAHSDGLCSVYARMFEHAPHLVLPTYLKWKSHSNPWLRRCSMVGTFYYARARKMQPDFALAMSLVSPHFQAPEYYVQKGVGWTIREMYNVYPSETIKLIQNNIHQISSIAWVAASEKLKKPVKQALLEKRKHFRKKSHGSKNKTGLQ